MLVSHHQPGSRMSQAVRVGDIVFLAGQIPQDLNGDITVQTREVLQGIDRVMAELGGNKSNVVSVQVWLSDMSDFQGMNAVWDEWVDKASPPARATGGVALARPGMRVEMIATAHL
ncbi:MAG: RidA family protein [Roseibium sp.]|uniref:RidA family protein n=1 Tax=Roseibium sp. TaxID=1936156 RepID=UPI0026041F64|nr:RidA family protein [Roseibium sp.]MCV0424807.1 RidA family protein [Roseibium sp.]